MGEANLSSHTPTKSDHNAHSRVADDVETATDGKSETLNPIAGSTRRAKKSSIAAEEFFLTQGAPGGRWGSGAVEYGLQRGFSLEELKNEGLRFRDHHLSKGNAFSDWQAAWRLWLSRTKPGYAAHFAAPRQWKSQKPSTADYAAQAFGAIEETW